MFTAPKILIVDDKEHHMTGLQTAFDQLQASTRLLHYVAEDIENWTPISGVRLVFIDKNLTELSTTTGSDNTTSFTAIIEVLGKIISKFGGPYGLIIWAESPDLKEFKEFFDERVDKSTFPCPAFCVAMTKTDHIDIYDGTVIDPKKLQDEIVKNIESNPQMAALLNWEVEVSAAMSKVLSTLFSLLPDIEISEGVNEELGNLLNHLAVAGGGAERAKEDPKHSAELVLHALLSDRLDAEASSSGASDVWKAATKVAKESKPAGNVKAAINTALHLEFNEEPKDKSSRFSPTKTGALITYPFGDIEKTLPRTFGLTLEDFCGSKMGNMPEEDFKECRLIIAKIGAVCDDAQPKLGPVKYVLGLEWPFTNPDGTKTGKAKRHRNKSWGTDAVFETPEFMVGEPNTPGKITFFLNLTISVPKEMAQRWETTGRLRGEMSTTLTQSYARNLSRPGFAKL